MSTSADGSQGTLAAVHGDGDGKKEEDTAVSNTPSSETAALPMQPASIPTIDATAPQPMSAVSGAADDGAGTADSDKTEDEEDADALMLA